MARLNEEFQLTFHEVDSDIQIEFGEDPVTLAFGEIKERLPIPVEFEEFTSRIPVSIADHDELEALFGDVIIVNTGGGSGEAHKAIYLYTTTGTLTAAQKRTLQANYSNYIVYQDSFYKLKFKSGNTYKYYTQTPITGLIQYFQVDMISGDWYFYSVVDEHPLDMVRHITAEERSFWNNKLNCENTVSGERLILNRN